MWYLTLVTEVPGEGLSNEIFWTESAEERHEIRMAKW